MIKPEELRIGNLVWNPVQKIPVKVDLRLLAQIDRDYKSNLDKDLHFQAIPLTEEWLIKLGFKQEVNSKMVKFWRIEGLTIYHEYYLHNVEDNLEWFFLSSSEYKIRIYSLHQLQNLFYSLTGEELKLK
jgi:hypothetical protein